MKGLLLLSICVGAALAFNVSVQNKETKTYCIVLEGNATGKIEYYDDNLNETQTYEFVVNSTVSSLGKCLATVPGHNTTVDEVTIAFVPNDVFPPTPVKDRWTLKLVFTPGSDKESFRIADFELKAFFYDGIFNSSTYERTYNKSKDAELEWSAEKNNGFSCSATDLKLENNSHVEFTGLKVIAFAMLSDPVFPPTQLFEQCKVDVRTSDLVPIVVGACLAGLVIIVLVAYLIGRARAKRQGYASV